MKWNSESPAEVLFGGTGASRFGRRQRRPRGIRLPVFAVTGFLGSGKTTLIRALLARAEGANTAVVVNEYGEIGIDDALLRSSSDTTVLLGNGCVCCSLRTDLQETLRTLFVDRSRGAVPSFTRILIETSGLADPGPILQTFGTDRALGREFYLQALVTVVDAVNGFTNLETMSEARKQVALADRIVVSKTDRVDADTTARLLARLATVTAVPIQISQMGVVDPSLLSDEAPVTPRSFDLGGEHTQGLQSFSLIYDEPFRWPAFDQAMAVLSGLRGPDLLRVKGLVAVEGCAGPLVVHFVQHIADPPVELEKWPGEDRRTRLVFVTRGLVRAAVERLFAGVNAIGGAPPR